VESSKFPSNQAALTLPPQHELLLTAIIYSYFEQVLTVDPDSIWLDLCLNRGLAKDRSRAFLRRFVKDSVKRVPTLGPEEYELKRTLYHLRTHAFAGMKYPKCILIHAPCQCSQTHLNHSFSLRIWSLSSSASSSAASSSATRSIVIIGW